MSTTGRYWRATHDIFNYYGVYHEAPSLQPEDVQRIALRKEKHSFRFLWHVGGSRNKTADLPFGAQGLLMSYPAATVLLPLISDWTNIQSDVLVEGEPTHVLAIVTEVYDAMNPQTTIGRYHESGIWLEVTEMHLVSSRIGPSPIFRLATTGVQWDFILSEEIVEVIRSNGLTGLKLQEVVLE